MCSFSHFEEAKRESVTPGSCGYYLEIIEGNWVRAVEETGWPLLRTWEATPLEAGSVVIYSHNLFHRGNHRRDEHGK
jgi:hypothetical protein